MAGLRGDQVALYLKDMYKAEREGYMEEPTMYDKIFKVVNGVKGAGDKATQILGAGDLTRHTAENQDVLFKSPVQGWEYLVRYWTYSDGLVFSKESVEDTVKLGNLLKDLAETWGISVRVTKEDFAATVFNKGGVTASAPSTDSNYVFNGSHTGNAAANGNLLYDNKPMFNLTGNARSIKGSTTTFYNAISGNAISPANFETLYNLYTKTNNRDERNRIIRIVPDTMLTEPGADAFAAEKLLDTSRGLPGGQLNDTNPYYKLVTPMIWHYLTDGAWYIGKRQHKDFQFHERQQSEIRFFRDESNLGYKASINIRIGVFIKNWRVWARSNGTYSAT